MRHGLATTLACALALSVSSCSSEAPPRPQVVLIIDTDLPPSGLAAADDTFPVEATVDTIRVEALDEHGTPYEEREFIVPERADWPLSLGISSQQAPVVRLRIRAFRASLARGYSASKTDFEPHRTVTIDRLVTLDLPDDGVTWLRVTLEGDCFGTPSRFIQPWKTCVNGSALAGDPSDGLQPLETGTKPASRAGTWSGLELTPCVGATEADAVCIPGGFSLLGDPTFVGWRDDRRVEDTMPRHAAVLSPFWMDRTEVTVGRYRQLRAEGALSAEEPREHGGPGVENCTWLGVDRGANDMLPINCIRWEAALEVCEASGGTLPTEAQWEHAARGRQRASTFPWGEQQPRCCAAGYGHGTSYDCGAGSIAPVMSFPPSSDCAGLGDLSRDGVYDLAGNVAEFTRDSFLRFDDPCWMARGVHRDPLCEDLEAASLRLIRGGDFVDSSVWLISAVRRGELYTGSSEVGFRCVYPAVAP